MFFSGAITQRLKNDEVKSNMKYYFNNNVKEIMAKGRMEFLFS